MSLLEHYKGEPDARQRYRYSGKTGFTPEKFQRIGKTDNCSLSFFGADNIFYTLLW
jgi:hypothetical protein